VNSEPRCRPSGRSTSPPADEDPDRSEKSRGVVLVIVIWFMTALTTLASGFSMESGMAVRQTRNTLQSAEARALADGAVFVALRSLLDDNAVEPWPVDGTVRQVPVGDSLVSVVVLDEAGKVDLNYAPEEMLLNLLTGIGVGDDEAASLADAIADWRDTDDLKRLRGAEAADYRRAGLSAVPSNAPFAAVSELRLVLGMTPEIYRRLAPLVTVYSRSPRVNPVSAPAAVVRALPGIPPETAEAFLAARGSADGQLNEAVATLARAGQFIGRATPQAVTIRATATLPSGSSFVREATVEFPRGREATYRIAVWRQAIDTAATVAEDGNSAAGGEKNRL
jgi:general secretion pathway protein K